MTKQEIFNRVKKHLLKQNKKSISERIEFPEGTSNRCRYRTEVGLKCAIGCLIPDSKYESGVEGESVDSLVTQPYYRFLIPTDCDDKESTTFLKCLQYIHDHSIPSKWKSNLEDFAARYSLKS